MKTSYSLALKHFVCGLPLNNSGIGVTAVSIGSSLAFYDLHKFRDNMNFDPYTKLNGKTAKYFIAFHKFLGSDKYIDLNNSNEYFDVGDTQLSYYLEDITKAMIISILDGNSKRTTSVGIGSTAEKRQIFFNCLKKDQWKDTTLKPWSNDNVGWTSSYGSANPISVSRNNNIATVVTDPAHGLSTSFDDWGVVMTLNTGIATSFNISTSTYPNGVPIRITSPSTFEYDNIGINTSITEVTGNADIRVGWGGTSINLHLYFT
jgi:hypothetical protein